MAKVEAELEEVKAKIAALEAKMSSTSLLSGWQSWRRGRC